MSAIPDPPSAMRDWFSSILTKPVRTKARGIGFSGNNCGTCRRPTVSVSSATGAPVINPHCGACGHPVPQGANAVEIAAGATGFVKAIWLDEHREKTKILVDFQNGQAWLRPADLELVP